MRNIAHRGASAYAPENTLAAFDLAIEMGADAIETDIQITADGHLVLVHDDVLDRTSNGTGCVIDHTLAHLRTLDFGSWFGPEHAGLRILTLQEVLTTYLARIPLVLEIKDPAAADSLIRAVPQSSRIEITSFDWDAIVHAARRAGSIRCGFLTPEFSLDVIERCVVAGLRQICPHADTVTPVLVARAHERGLDVRAWGVSRREQTDQLRAAGADGTTCNWPDWLA